ncbi:MAG: Bax inhibitor-1/YccA family protein [Rhodospirillales bacterium]|nr:Bax inhibitor-1/YccA family protein [Rhodospirillales bacterium]MBO6787776.1 Bax inhibitor-1/YccA family protein [Rhodospirillales bacterium]
MALGPNNRFGARAGRMDHSQAYDASIDMGLRKYMLGVYNYMTLGVAITGLMAYVVSTQPAVMQAIFGTGLSWVVMLAPLAFILVLNFGIHKLSASATQLMFWAFASVMGLSLSTIFIAYTDASIARVFFITAGAFAGLSLYGYTTKRDLTGFGSFLVMGLIGIIIASIVNIFLASSALQFAISVIGVLVFAGLTAYDTQRIKSMYYEGDSAETMTKKSVMGALSLYLDFINLFLMLLHLFGNRE